MNPILREIARLRQRVVRVEISRSLLDAATVGVLLSGVAVLVAQLFRRPFYMGAGVGGALLLLCVVVGVVWGMRNGRRSDIFLAKWIDLENKLEDRFASSYDFQATNDQNRFSQACVQSTLTLLAQRTAPLQLPHLPVGSAWWRPLAATGLIVAGALLFQITRPTSIASLDARRRLRVPRAAAQAVQTAAARLKDLPDPKVKQIGEKLRDLAERVVKESASKEEVLREIAEAEQAIKAVQRDLSATDFQVPELAGLPAGAVKDLAGALDRRDLQGAVNALQEVAKAAGAGQLSAAETAALARMVRELDQAVGRQTPGLTGVLDQAALAIDKGPGAETQAALVKVATELPKAKQAFDTGQAIRKMIAQLDNLKQRTRNDGQTPDPSDPLAKGPPTAPGPGKTPGPGVTGKGHPPGTGTGEPGGPISSEDPITDRELDRALAQGIGAGSGDAVGTDARQPGAATPATGRIEHVTGAWQGKTLRQLVSASEGGGTPADKAELRRLVASYSEVAQRRVQREEIPASYSGAVRRYFDQVRLLAER